MAVQCFQVDGNILSVDSQTLAQMNGEIRFSGKGGSVTIGSNCSWSFLNIIVGNGCDITIGDDCKLGMLEIYSVYKSCISIGHRSVFQWSAALQCHEPFDISIGDDCLFASGTRLTVSDMHPIYDRETGDLINAGADVNLGDKVWLGQDVIVLKGRTIGSGSVVGVRSVVSRDLPSDCIAVGTPARVVRRNVEWALKMPDPNPEA